MNNISKKLHKLLHELDVSGSGYNPNKIGKDLNNAAIKQYIKTSEIDSLLDINDAYMIALRGAPGFYVIDGAKYDKILNNIKGQDSLIRKKTLNDLKKNYPILCQQKKTKRLIIKPLEKNFIWDISLFHQCIKSLCEESVFCSTDTFNTPIVDQYHIDSFRSIYVDCDENENAKNILICVDPHKKYPKDTNPKDIHHLEKFDEKKYNEISLKKINITNNKMIFFTPEDYDQDKSQHRFRVISIKPENKEERVVKCLNGEYEIRLYVDDIFQENINKEVLYEKEYDEKLKSLIKEFNTKHNINIEEFGEFDESEVFMEFKMQLNAFDLTLEKKYEKYENKNIGEHIYHIKLI